ncbi:MAG: ATP synthase F1 subunit delta [Vicingaceae bacterium]|nr:ATP synthase F1 subunit delta [Vicingaceae bacterium]
MLDIKVAPRYAKSLIDLGIEQNTLEHLYNDMQLIHQICKENPELVLLLKSPIVRSDKKESILKEVFFDSLSLTSTTFITLILKKKREAILDAIAKAFISQYKTHHNIKIAKVTTAIALNDVQKNKIISLLEKSEKATIELNEVVNPEIIGGMILRVDDRQIDESIKRKLNNLEMEFDDNPYVKEY